MASWPPLPPPLPPPEFASSSADAADAEEEGEGTGAMDERDLMALSCALCLAMRSASAAFFSAWPAARSRFHCRVLRFCSSISASILASGESASSDEA